MNNTLILQIIFVLTFLSKIGHTTADIIQLAAKIVDPSLDLPNFADYLIELGFLNECEILPGVFVYALSRKGIYRFGGKKVDLEKVNYLYLEHATGIHYLILEFIDVFNIVDFMYEPQLISNEFRPDATLYNADETWFNLEYERTKKSPGNGSMARFFQKIIDRPTVVVFSRRSNLDLYLKYASQYLAKGIPYWAKVDGTWFMAGTIPFPQEALLTIRFRMYGCLFSLTLEELLRGETFPD